MDILLKDWFDLGHLELGFHVVDRLGGGTVAATAGLVGHGIGVVVEFVARNTPGRQVSCMGGRLRLAQ